MDDFDNIFTEMEREKSDYEKYRGKCKEMSEELVKKDSSLRLVRGYYWCHAWGKQEHWWTEDKDGNIIDPTKDQFPSKGFGHYEEFDGYFECERCGKRVKEEDAHVEGHHIYCSQKCYVFDVGMGAYWKE